MLSRRFFLKSSAAGLLTLAAGSSPGFLARTALASPVNEKKNVLVVVFQRGAMDGLAAVQPLADANLQKLRPNLCVKSKELLELDGTYGLHPALGPLDNLFGKGQLAIVHGVGSPNKTRSHFDAQSYMELGTPFRKGGHSGWLNRTVGLLNSEATPFRALSLTKDRPQALDGPNLSINLSSLEMFRDQDNANKSAIEELYRSTNFEFMRENAAHITEISRVLNSKSFENYSPRAPYPVSLLANSLKETAQLIKAAVGLEIAFLETDGWDTHHQQGNLEGGFARRAREFAQALSAFWLDLEAQQNSVTVLTMTEFGRTVHQNASGGTDHGRGSCSFILGNSVRGGRVHGTIPALAIENLEDGRDIPVTTDFRSVFSEVAQKHLKLTSTKNLFPGWQGTPLDLFRA